MLDFELHECDIVENFFYTWRFYSIIEYFTVEGQRNITTSWGVAILHMWEQEHLEYVELGQWIIYTLYV